MKILNISNKPLWMWGENKGIPSIFFPQREFATMGHEVYFLCPLKEGESRYSINSGIRVYRFDFPFNFKKNIYIQTDNIFGRLRGSIMNNLNWFFLQVFSLFWGIKIGLKIKPDIVYAHDLTLALPAYLVSKVLSSKLVIRVYGTRQLYWWWKYLWRRIKEWRDYLSFKIPADYFVITNDGNCGHLLARNLGVSDKKIRYWRNGIDKDMYEPEPEAKKEICQKLNIKPSSKIIVSTCRLLSIYGVNKLLSALVDLFKKEHSAVCLIAGSGPERRKLEEFVRKNNISSRVFFFGIVDRQMIRKILNAGDIFVLLAQFHNCTNTMWEAMACGKCIVTTETEPIKEVLTSGDNAILVSPDNFKSVPKILEDLLNNDDLRNELGKKARIRAQEILEPWSKRAEKEAELLEALVGGDKIERS